VEKSAYLDAMGIIRWSQEREGQQNYIILVDQVSSELENHPIIATVLDLIDCPFTLCTFTSSFVKGADVIWDMRRMKVPKSNAVLTSVPLNELEKTVESKRELWSQIVAKQQDNG
jgi:DNA polymerase III psi subunit